MSLVSYPKIYLYRRVVQAKMFMDEHYHEDINLSGIADEAFFSKFHFTRLFKSIYGRTPHQYLTSVRIDQAKHLLQINKSVADVCYEVGFGSVSSFSGLFSKIVGQSPSVFQLKHQQRLQAVAEMPLNFIPNCFAEKKGWIKNSNFQDA
ncbi:MAG: helix-turn-helix transcriptional regulator [Saprospiraceae bacterium]|uniref:Helix-turn-helix transcriptional regulator n=1 Tax=Candidatus Opimibacter skivensis TaxID=2982028 RepID=A0A9D7XMH6_9BACT|nr:helix-turn-helix transcriptional regulator [Candidatus Opimibacter skivensis]